MIRQSTWCRSFWAVFRVGDDDTYMNGADANSKGTTTMNWRRDPTLATTERFVLKGMWHGVKNTVWDTRIWNHLVILYDALRLVSIDNNP
jgi:hypothetical protein